MNTDTHPMVYATLALPPTGEVQARVYQPSDQNGQPDTNRWLQISVPCTGCSIATCGTPEQIASIIAQLQASLAALPVPEAAEVPS